MNDESHDWRRLFEQHMDLYHQGAPDWMRDPADPKCSHGFPSPHTIGGHTLFNYDYPVHCEEWIVERGKEPRLGGRHES